MGRKSVEEIANDKKPYGRQSIWTAIRRLNKTASKAGFTRAEIFDACQHEINKATIKTYLDGLVAAKYLLILNKNIFPIRYKLENDCGAEAPRVRKDGSEITQGLGTEAMWRTIKNLSPFTIGELVLVAGTEKAPIKEATAKTYVQYLVKAKYVRVNKSRNPKSYSFVNSKNPGPLAPQIQRIHQVFDPNTQTVVWPEGGVK